MLGVDSLAALQREILALLYTPEARGTARVRSDAISASDRLQIYRNNLRANFYNVMALEFPVLLQLCGEDYFRQLALSFQNEHPSRQGNLHHIGEGFAAWLATQMADSPYAWFADVAALEWAWQECYVAAEHADTADLTQLAQLSAEQQESLRFVLKSSCRVLRSRWPVLSIWQAHQSAAADGGVALEQINMNQPQSVLIYRTAQGVLLRGLGDGAAELLQALAAGETLSAALERAMHAQPDADPAAGLQLAAKTGLIADLIVSRA